MTYMLCQELSVWFPKSLMGGLQVLPDVVMNMQIWSGRVSRYPDSQNVTGSQYNKAYFFLFGRVMYSYNSKYMITANFRADESSKFKKGNRWGYFPSFSVGWRISEEPWMKDATSSWLNNLKLRATLGWIGSANAVGRYDYQSVVETDNRYYNLVPNQIILKEALPMHLLR